MKKNRNFCYNLQQFYKIFFTVVINTQTAYFLLQKAGNLFSFYYLQAKTVVGSDTVGINSFNKHASFFIFNDVVKFIGI